MEDRRTAGEFLSKFLDAYTVTWKSLPPDLQQEVWMDREKWNHLMLWKTAWKPRGLDKTVLTRTAETMNLEYYEGEPLRLDGAFYSTTHASEHTFPFPILVAFEHENDHRGFDNEIVKLLSVRCPLKVGITYTLLAGASNTFDGSERVLEQIRSRILRNFKELAELIGEDASSEYLFLVGVEVRIRSLQWHAMIFSAGEGPAKSQFVPAKPDA